MSPCSHDLQINPNAQYSGPPAKRPRLEDVPQQLQPIYTPMQTCHPSQSAQSIGYFASSSTQQGDVGLTSHGIPTTVYSNYSHPRASNDGQEWTITPQSLSGGWMAPSSGCYSSHTFSTMHQQTLGAGHVQLTYSEQSNYFMESQRPILPPLAPPGHIQCNIPRPHAYTPALWHLQDGFQNTPDPMVQFTPVPDDRDMKQDVGPDDLKDVESETVCFGRIPNITASYENHGASDIPPRFAVQIKSSARFTCQDIAQIDGRIPPDYGEMIQGLIDESTVVLHIFCLVNNKSKAKVPFRKFELLPCDLEITVYGPLDISDEIGDWFQAHGIYLQDPRSCHMEVKYCNPQRLSACDIEACPLLSDIILDLSKLDLQVITSRRDALDILSGHADLFETTQPSVIKTTMKKHQKQALTFMLQREKGWGFNNGQSDIWEKVDTATGGRRFMNTISEVCQAEEPPQFYGGIVADPMGLGKTLTMVALVATDLDTGPADVSPAESDNHEIYHTSATLIIIPPPLIGSWEEQLIDHVAVGGLKFRRHHGQTKLMNTKELDDVNIVLTTYQTVSAEWKSDKLPGSSILFQVRWRRIILDEAHFIRNGKSRMARAICDLDSVARWAVTGTPVQNRLGDLVSLLKFIRVYPYETFEQFNTDISDFWKSGKEQDAVKRLQRLSACLLLRRSQETIDLPARQDYILPILLTEEERKVYNELREQTISKIDESLHKAPGTSTTGGYVSVLQQIESLRLFCNLGLQYHSRHEKNIQFSDWNLVAQSTFHAESELHPITCLKCSSTFDGSESLIDDSTIRRLPLYFNCLRFLCTECVSEIEKSGRNPTCGHRSLCAVSTVSPGSTLLEEISDLMIDDAHPNPKFTSLPSKVEALIKHIQTVPTDEKCIVFSTWRLTLDLVERGLNQASISSIRFDGKVPQKDRQDIIDKFRTDPTIRVLLLTLSCGAVGLTLTAASRAYLMEPHWNPTLEEQALARIYRLGQTREVATVRLFVKDSFEEQVMQLQESKKHLASVLLSPHDGGQSDNSLKALEKLRRLL